MAQFKEATLTTGDKIIVNIDEIRLMHWIQEATTIRRRLRSRRLESDEAIHRRLEIAKSEIPYYGEYDYIVVNDVLENSFQLLESIVRSGHAFPMLALGAELRHPRQAVPGAAAEAR